MRPVLFASSTNSSPAHSSYNSSPLRDSCPSMPNQTFSKSMMEENLEIAEAVITKWNIDGPNSYSNINSLFRGDRMEAKLFLKSVKDLQAAMHFFMLEDSSSEPLVRAKNLMQVAMTRLENEFYQILSTNRNYLDPESVSSHSSRVSWRSNASDVEDDAFEGEIPVARDSVSEVHHGVELAMSDLKAIADSMISSGYSKECVKIYKIIRRSIVDESLYYLGVEQLSSSQFQKMDWEVIELKIKSWLNASKSAFKVLFHGERLLCNHVFSSTRIADSCFAEIAKDGALSVLKFPEQVAKSKKLSPEKMFRVLDLYDGISELWPEIEFFFSYELTSAVNSQAVTSLIKLGEAIRMMLSDFEAAILKESSKSPVPGGGIHPLTRYVMNYFVFLSDYSGILSDIVADWPLSIQFPLPESYISSPIPDDGILSAFSTRLSWLILFLLAKLDGKAQLYKDVPLSYLFLANNLNYVVSKVYGSNLRLLLGDDWLVKHEMRIKQYAANYERMGWSKVMSSLPELNPTASISLEAAGDCFRSFYASFEETHRKQTSWVVPDPKLGDEIRVRLEEKIVPAYRAFYEKYREMFRREMGVESLVEYAPEDLTNYLSDLFRGTGHFGNVTSSPPSLISVEGEVH
ncbi:hypothetical protein U1Q18_020911 [Sarracenia purpurea var. burkii]